MSISVSPVKRFKSGNLFVNMARITVSADDEYPNPVGGEGGYNLAPAQLGMDVVHGAMCESLSGYKFIYDTVNQKLKAFECPDADGPATELADSSQALRGAVVHVVAMGR